MLIEESLIKRINLKVWIGFTGRDTASDSAVSQGSYPHTLLHHTPTPSLGLKDRSGKSLRGRKAETEKGGRRKCLEQSERVTLRGREEGMVKGREGQE